MQVPRKIPGVILSASNRAEMMVRCKAPAGKRLVLSAGNVDGFSTGGNTWWSDEVYRIIQPKLATIVITVSHSSCGLWAVPCCVVHLSTRTTARQACMTCYRWCVAALLPDTQPSQARAQRAAAQRVFSSSRNVASGAGSVARAASTSPTVLTELVEESCTPRRPSYAVDIRDEALAKAGYTRGIVEQGVVFGGQLINGVQCQVNGENFTFPDPNPLVMPLGKIVEWTYNVVRGWSRAQDRPCTARRSPAQPAHTTQLCTCRHLRACVSACSPASTPSMCTSTPSRSPGGMRPKCSPLPQWATTSRLAIGTTTC